MRTFGRVETTIWQSAKFRACSERARLLYLYALACPHGNAVGCFILPEGYIMADMEWPSETVSKTLSELSSKGLLERCPHTSLTRITGWWGHNKLENPNIAIAALRCINALPFKSQVFHNFINDIKQYKEGFKETVWSVIEKGLPNDLPNPLPMVLETKEMEMEMEPKSSEANASDAPSAASPVPRETEPPSPASQADPIPLWMVRTERADIRKILFDHGKPWLARINGKPAAAQGAMLAKWLKAANDDAKRLWDIMVECDRDQRADPIGWITACLSRPHASGADPLVKRILRERAEGTL